MPSLGLFPEGLLLSIQTWTSAASHLQLHCTRLASYQFTLARVFLLISMAFLSSSPSSDTYRSCHTITTMPLLKPVVGQLNAFCVFFFSQCPLSSLRYSATAVFWFSDLFHSQSVLKAQLCLEKLTYINLLKSAELLTSAEESSGH